MLESHTAPRGTFPAFSVHVERLEELPAQLRPSTPRFVLLVAADTRLVDYEALVDWAREVLNRGATYVCCWGPDAERLEASFDWARLQRENFERTGRVIMTTSHDGESLTEAAWFALHVAFPDDGWAEGTGTTILATVANQSWSSEIRSYLNSGAPAPSAA